ncbi:hypothetical protein GBAR_LOCUS3684, partial [Geodia barretti]
WEKNTETLLHFSARPSHHNLQTDPLSNRFYQSSWNWRCELHRQVQNTTVFKLTVSFLTMISYSATSK